MIKVTSSQFGEAPMLTAPAEDQGLVSRSDSYSSSPGGSSFPLLTPLGTHMVHIFTQACTHVQKTYFSELSWEKKEEINYRNDENWKMMRKCLRSSGRIARLAPLCARRPHRGISKEMRDRKILWPTESLKAIHQTEGKLSLK